MKRFLISLAFVGALVIPAKAADMPIAYKAPMISPAYSWSGLYLGAHIGADASNVNVFNSVATVDMGTMHGGVLVGYNWQFHPNWLVGLEADLATATEDQISVAGFSVKYQEQLSGNVRARFGFVANRTLLFVAGGYSILDGKASISGFGTPLSDSQMHSGWNIGAGIEQAITNNWALRAEYIYRAFANQNYNFAGTMVPIKVNDNIVRAAITYKF